MTIFIRVGLFLAALCTPWALWAASEPAHMYVCAHPDDCVLFMNPDLYNDIAGGAGKTVIIYLTAGDAGEVWRANKTSYPYVREQASLLAADWMSAIGRTQPNPPPQVEMVTIHGHTIRRVRSAQVVSYFLRLPDGNMYGEGFARYGHESLQKLKEGAIKAISAVDGTARYVGWQDMVVSLGTIIEKEAENHGPIALHFPDTDTRANHDDHSDHQHGAQAIMQWLEHVPQAKHCYTIYQHLDYAIADLPPNLDAVALRNTTASFAVLTAMQQRDWGYHHWNEAHTRYLGRNYVTHRTMPSGCGEAPDTSSQHNQK